VLSVHDAVPTLMFATPVAYHRGRRGNPPGPSTAVASTGGIHAMDQPVVVVGVDERVPALRRSLSVEDDLDLPVVPSFTDVRAVVPDGHGARAVLASRDLPFEGGVLEGVVFGLHREVVLLRIRWKSF